MASSGLRLMAFCQVVMIQPLTTRWLGWHASNRLPYHNLVYGAPTLPARPTRGDGGNRSNFVSDHRCSRRPWGTGWRLGLMFGTQRVRRRAP